MSVTEERLIAASPAAVWSVVSNPAIHPRLDARSQLESTVGDAGQPSSEYVLVVGAAAGIKVRLRYMIVDAQPNVRLVAAVSRDGKNHSEQRAEIWPNRDGTLLRWTVTAPGGLLPPTRRLLAVVMAHQLRTWLLAVEREALVESS